jgi:shikimate dehydrogenase
MDYSALIGNPTDHSVSHVLYAELAKVVGIPNFYQHIRLNVHDDELAQSLDAFAALHFVGLSVTLPYKLDVIEHLDELDSVVNDLGAVNTIKLGKKRVGYNTDWVGIVESIRALGSKADYESVVIFGTGGAARAAIYACKELGVQGINVVYREKASPNTINLRERSSQLHISLHPYSEVINLLHSARLVINTTSAGMIGNEKSPFDLDTIEKGSLSDKVFLDAVFNPLRTPLLERFEYEGATTIDGLWMMIYQGVRALGIWFDRDIQVGASELQRIHNLLEKELQKHV